MDDVTFTIFKVVFSVCLALATVYLVPYLKTLRNDARYKSMIDMIAVAVRAAEQTITGSGQGAIKKDHVMEFVREWLAKQGITITDTQLSDLIESAVWSMNNNG